MKRTQLAEMESALTSLANQMLERMDSLIHNGYHAGEWDRQYDKAAYLETEHWRNKVQKILAGADL